MDMTTPEILQKAEEFVKTLFVQDERDPQHIKDRQESEKFKFLCGVKWALEYGELKQSPRWVKALEEIRSMKLLPGETDYKYAFNRCWHIAHNALKDESESPKEE